MTSATHVRRLSAFVPTTATQLGLLLVGALLVAASIRFWLHDVLPYIADYTEASYRRYWPSRQSLLLHIAGGSIALFAGPFQLWSGLRVRARRLHRWIGYAYVGGIALSASASFSLAFYTRPDFGLALFILAIVWLVTIGMAIVAIRNRRIDAHREWMIRSYIVTFSFVAYRLLVGLSMFKALGASRHAMVLWISWAVPMMIVEVFMQWHRVAPLKRRAVSATRSDAADHAWF